jgi:hypothetical protein
MATLKYVSILNKIEVVYHVEYRHMKGIVQIDLNNQKLINIIRLANKHWQIGLWI